MGFINSQSVKSSANIRSFVLLTEKETKFEREARLKHQQDMKITAQEDARLQVERQKQEQLEKTINFLKDQASKGTPSAQCSLGLRYLNGEGVPKDEILGREWLVKAAANGSTEAKAILRKLVNN